MYVTVATRYSEYRYDCDSVGIYQQLDEAEEYGFVRLEFRKDGKLIYDLQIEKSPHNKIYFMNNHGMTFDKISWPDTPK